MNLRPAFCDLSARDISPIDQICRRVRQVHDLEQAVAYITTSRCTICEQPVEEALRVERHAEHLILVMFVRRVAGRRARLVAAGVEAEREIAEARPRAVAHVA